MPLSFAPAVESAASQACLQITPFALLVLIPLGVMVSNDCKPGFNSIGSLEPVSFCIHPPYQGK